MLSKMRDKTKSKVIQYVLSALLIVLTIIAYNYGKQAGENLKQLEKVSRF